MSDDLKYAWPETEVRQPRPPTHPSRKQPIGAHELVMLKRYRHACQLARRWEAGDEDVTMQDIIDILLDR